MADERKPPETPRGGPRRKRTAPTIDLEATEVAKPAADNPEAVAPGPQPGTPTEAAPVVETPEAEPAPEQAAATPEPAAEERAESGSKRAMPPPSPPPPAPRGGPGGGLLGGAIGGLVVILLGSGLWYAGFLSLSANQTDLPVRITALEKQLQSVRNQPAPKFDSAALDKSVGELSQRVGKLESEVGNLPPADRAAAQKLAALDDSVKLLRDEVSALGQRMNVIAGVAEKAQQGAAAAQKALNDLQRNEQDAAAGKASVATAAFEALQSKIAALESELAKARSAIEGEIRSVRSDVTSAQERIDKSAASDTAARLALTATELRNAVVSGAPYAAQLAQVRSLGADAKALAPLEAFAARGVPGRNVLAGELSRLIPTMRKVAGAQKPSGSILERLQANAEKLVRIRPIEAPTGNDPGDVLARIEAAAARADIARALDDLAGLPDNVRAPAKDWIAKAKAREAALAAAQTISANAARALGKG